MVVRTTALGETISEDALKFSQEHRILAYVEKAMQAVPEAFADADSIAVSLKRDPEYGDYYVNINAVVPEDLDAEAQQHDVCLRTLGFLHASGSPRNHQPNHFMGLVMNPRSFRDLAADLAGNPDPSPAALRTAVSRAYYAIYNVAVAMLTKMGVKLRATWEAHQLVGEALRYSGDQVVSMASRDLDELRKARWAADYDMENYAVEDKRTVLKLVGRAKQAIKKLDECEADSARFMQARLKVRNWAGSADGAGKGFSLL